MDSQDVFYCFIACLQLMAFKVQTSPTYVINPPNTLGYGFNDSVLITIFDAIEPVHVDIYLEDCPSRNWRTDAVSGLVHPGKPTEILVATPRDIQLQGEQYVFMVTRGNSTELEFQRELKLLVTPRNGFVFIQTDKPVYSANQDVRIRLIQVDHVMRPVAEPVQIDILNPQNVVVERKGIMTLKDGVYVKTYKLPILALDGNWTITAYYGKKFALTSSLKVEVKEYVVPTFGVKISVPEYILDEPANITIQVEARYVYGKNVTGSVLIRLGIQTDKEIKMFRIMKGPIGPSHHEVKFPSRDIEVLGTDFWFISGARLFVEATVTETKSGTEEVAKTIECQFVANPYNVNMSRSRSFFKPGLPYTAKIDITKVNGKPATGIDVMIIILLLTENGSFVQPDIRQAVTDQRGRIEAGIKPMADTSLIQLTVRLKHGISEIFVSREFSPSGSYVMASIKQEEPVSIGSDVQVDILFNKPEKVSKMFYLVKTVSDNLYNYSISNNIYSNYTLELHVDSSMSPGFRLLVFYVYENEVVADSIFIDVIDGCENEVTVEFDKELYRPQDFVTIKIAAKPHTRVALLAVDQAVHLLGKGDQLAPTVLYNAMMSFDTGCGSTGGNSSDMAFWTTGFSVLTNADNFPLSTRPRYECYHHSPTPRKKRTDGRQKKSLADNETLTDETCCRLGGQWTLFMPCIKGIGHELRGVKASCRTMYLKCCQMKRYSSHHQPNYPAHRPLDPPKRTEPTRSVSVAYVFETNPKLEEIKSIIPTRHNFDEVWIFDEVDTGADGAATYRATAPDSITTWSVQAIGVNRRQSLCVAKPVNTTVFTEFFIQLSLPFSIIRQEQVELKVTLFNYANKILPVSVHIQVGLGVCAKLKAGEPSDYLQVWLPSHDSEVISFPIAPLEIGEHAIDVIATSISLDLSDRVLKWLNVIPEGEPVVDTYNIILDPNGELLVHNVANLRTESLPHVTTTRPAESHHIDLVPPVEAVPDSVHSTVSVIGTVLGNSVRHAIDRVYNLQHLPSDNGLQVITKLASTTYATLYLKKTGRLTHESPGKAADLILSGYNDILKFRNEDGSFSVFEGNPGNVWLTAMAHKVLALSHELGAMVENDVICDAILWLLSKQRKDGSFSEDGKLSNSTENSMTTTLALTALVAVSIAEVPSSCDHQASLHMAMSYLEEEMKITTHSELPAVVAYALKLSQSLLGEYAYCVLKDSARFDSDTWTRWWSADDGSRVTADAIEMTSYALLTALSHNDMEYSKPIVRWLNLNRLPNSEFISAKDTVVALQALAEYASRTENNHEIQLNATVIRQNDSAEVLKFHITKENSVVLSHNELAYGTQYNISTQGVGVGQMSVNLKYNTIANSKRCRFNTSVKAALEREWNFPQNFESGVAKCGKTSSELGSSRPKRSSRSLYTFKLTVDIRFLGNHDAGMSVVEVGLFTGFEAANLSLAILKYCKSDVIESYAITKRKVIFYLKTITHKSPVSLEFHISQIQKIGNTQPVAVKVKEEKNPDNKCITFYHPRRGSELLKFICDKPSKQCLCLEEKCPHFCELTRRTECTRETQPGLLNELEFILHICDMAEVAYVVRIINITARASYDVAEGRLVSTLKHGSTFVCVNSVLHFLVQSSCSYYTWKVFEVNKTYLVTGPDGIYPKDADGLERAVFGVTNENHVVEWPAMQRRMSKVTCSTRSGQCPNCYTIDKEKRCGRIGKNELRLPNKRGLLKFVCDVADTAFKVEIVNITTGNGYHVAEGRLKLVLKRGADALPVGSVLHLWLWRHCTCPCGTLLQVNKTYLVTGFNTLYWKDSDGSDRRMLTDTGESYILEWPTSRVGSRKGRRFAARLDFLIKKGCT